MFFSWTPVWNGMWTNRFCINANNFSLRLSFWIDPDSIGRSLLTAGAESRWLCLSTSSTSHFPLLCHSSTFTIQIHINNGSECFRCSLDGRAIPLACAQWHTIVLSVGGGGDGCDRGGAAGGGAWIRVRLDSDLADPVRTAAPLRPAWLNGAAGYDTDVGFSDPLRRSRFRGYVRDLAIYPAAVLAPPPPAVAPGRSEPGPPIPHDK